MDSCALSVSVLHIAGHQAQRLENSTSKFALPPSESIFHASSTMFYVKFNFLFAVGELTIHINAKTLTTKSQSNVIKQE